MSDAEAPARPARRRQNLGLAIAVFLGIVAVGLGLLFTLSSGDDAPADAPAAGPAGTNLADAVSTTFVVPDGDYAALCRFAEEQAVDFDPNGGIEAYRRVLEDLDLDALLAVAPEGLHPAIETIRAQRPIVLEALAQTDDVASVGPGDFPQGFLESFALLAAAGEEHCGAGAADQPAGP
ncbi:MAG: hypothetical protein R2702_14610 [Acidimicrobiales bacterium]